MALPVPPVFSNPANPLGDVPSPVGGISPLSDRGTINFYPVAATQAAPAFTVDVIDWQGGPQFVERNYAKGGAMGAMSSIRIAYGAAWKAFVLVDLRIQPLFAFAGMGGGQISLYTAEAYFKLGTAPEIAQAVPRFWWVPRAKISSLQAVVDAGGKKRVRYLLEGTAGSHTFIVPDFGDPRDGGSTQAGAYRVWISKNLNA